MKVHRHKGVPTLFSGLYKGEPFRDIELEHIRGAGYSEVWYWYATGNYEGTGYAILRKPGDRGYYVAYLGHCSCYGPTENIGDADRWTSIAAIIKGATKELRWELAPLLAMIKRQNKKR